MFVRHVFKSIIIKIEKVHEHVNKILSHVFVSTVEPTFCKILPRFTKTFVKGFLNYGKVEIFHLKKKIKLIPILSKISYLELKFNDHRILG